MPRLEPRVPTKEECVKYFREMVERGKTPEKSEIRQPIIETTLVTPWAQALEQAKSELRRKGEHIPGEDKVDKKATGKRRKKTTQSMKRAKR